MNNTILHINSSGRFSGSVTRDISTQLVTQLQQQRGTTPVQRDLAEGIPFIDENWITANFTDPEQRTEAQQTVLGFSDELIEELQ